MNCAGDVSSTTNQHWIRMPDPGNKVSLYSSLQVLSFSFFIAPFFLLCSTQDPRRRVKIVKSSTIVVERGLDFQWVGFQWLNSGVGAWSALNTASVGRAKQLFAHSTSVNPHPLVCSWTAASRHFPPEKTLPSNTCEPQCQIPWQVLMAFTKATKALRILISWVLVAHSIQRFLSFCKLLSRNTVLQQNPTATSPLDLSPKFNIHNIPAQLWSAHYSWMKHVEATWSGLSPQACFSFQRKIRTSQWWSRPLQTWVTLEMSITPAHCRRWRVSLLLSLVHQVSKMMCAESPLGILSERTKGKSWSWGLQGGDFIFFLCSCTSPIQ